MSKVDWNSIGDQKGGGGNTGELVFLQAKNLPLTLLPDTGSDAESYESVWDAEAKRSRPPVAGEKAKVHFLFYALFLDETTGKKTVKICDAGTSVAKAIQSVQKSLSNLGFISFVKVTAKGSGLDTEYAAEAVKVVEKPIPTDIWDKLKSEEDFKKLPTLEEMKNRILGLTKKETAGTPAPDAAPAKKVATLSI